MPWCPKCKTEYREGIKTCADCNVSLVDELNEEATECIATFEEEATASKFLEFLKYSKIESAELSFDIKEDAFKVYSSEEESMEAKKLFSAFKKTESETVDSTEEEDIDEASEDTSIDSEIPLENIMPSTSLTYVKKKDKYDDLRSTFWIFMIFGIGMLIFTALNVLEIITFINNYFQYGILTVVSLFFIFVAIKSLIDSKHIYHEISSEEENTVDIKDWLKENIKPADLAQFDDDMLADEVIFFKKTEYIKNKLLEAYDIDNDSYADEVIEEFYTEYIENADLTEEQDTEDSDDMEDSTDSTDSDDEDSDLENDSEE